MHEIVSIAITLCIAKKKKKIYAGIITISMHLHTVLTRVAPLILLIKEIMRLLKAITVTEQDLYIHS